jgi:hypothetical protein
LCDDFIFCFIFFNLTLKLQQTHGFVSEIINEQDDKTAAEASAAKQEDSTAQTSPLSQHTQAAECNRTCE